MYPTRNVPHHPTTLLSNELTVNVGKTYKYSHEYKYVYVKIKSYA